MQVNVTSRVFVCVY